MIYYSHMLLETLFPILPTSPLDISIHVIAAIGCMLLAYGVFLEQERRQDLVYIIAASCLLVYAIHIQNLVFIIAMSGFALASGVEFIEIYTGLHKHGKEDLKKYKKL